MAAGIISAMPEIANYSPLYLACVTAAIAGGATVMSHFNDSGFWLVKSLLQIDEKTTLKSWTVMETIVGGVGFLGALVISFFA
jgi:GntP family gluconate:H+ symporter/Gnt-I system low-affinity gluconate transporter